MKLGLPVKNPKIIDPNDHYHSIKDLHVAELILQLKYYHPIVVTGSKYNV